MNPIPAQDQPFDADDLAAINAGLADIRFTGTGYSVDPEAWAPVANPIRINRMLNVITAPRGTDAQILKEREITAAAIQGAMSFGYQGSEYPPEEDHWLRPFYELGQAGRVKDLQIAAGVSAGWHLKRHVDSQVDAITVTHPALGEVTAALHSDTPQSRMLFWLCDDVLKDRKALGAEPHRLAHTDHINTTPNPADPQDLRDYKALCDLWQEANAVDTAIGRPEVLLEKIRRLRDDFGSRRQSAPKALGVELPYGDGVRRGAPDPQTPAWAAYFIRRFKHEEKLLGPNEQAALDYVLALLAATAPVGRVVAGVGQLYGELPEDTDLFAARPAAAAAADSFQVRIAGPDDVVPFTDELAALRHANAVNQVFVADCLKNPDDHVLCVATVHDASPQDDQGSAP